MTDEELLSLYSSPSSSIAPKSDSGKPLSDDDLIKLYTKGGSTSTPVEDKPKPVTDYIDPVTGRLRISVVKNEPSSPISDVASSVSSLSTNFATNVAKDYQSGISTIGSGLSDIGENRPASGVGKIALGGLAALTSPLTGATKTFVTDLVTQLTGNPDIGERAGFVASSAIPVVPATKAIKAAVPKNQALSILADTIGQENLPEVVQRLEANPRLSVADVSQPVRQMTQQLAVTEGPHQTQLSKFVQNRQATAKGAVESAYTDAMGAPVDVSAKLNQLKSDAKAVGKKQIEPALANSNPVDLSSVISHIDNQLNPGVNAVISTGQQLPSAPIQQRLGEIRKFLTDNKSVMTDPKRLHQIQSALRVEGDNLLSSSVGADRSLGYSVMNLRNHIVNAIDQASGGKYKPALSSYADEMQVQEAFNKGTEITRNRPTNFEDRPEFWKDWITNAKPAEVQAAKEGARIAIDQQINGMRAAARGGTNIPEVEFNSDKLAALFGKKETDKLYQQLKDERAIAETNQKLYNDSQTAFRQKANARVDLPTEKPMGLGAYMAPVAEIAGNLSGIPGTSALVLGGMGMKKLAYKASLALAKRKNQELVNLVTSSGPDRQELIDNLKRIASPSKPSMLQIGRNALSNVLPP